MSGISASASPFARSVYGCFFLSGAAGLVYEIV